MRHTRLLTLVSAGAVAGLALSACSSGESGDSSSGRATPPAMEAMGALGDGEGEVNILAWAGYAEDGSTDPAVDWVTPFEAATGCTANVQVADTSDSMFE
jgi:putative spermidine/putrescine transport system substrate-binding protein